MSSLSEVPRPDKPAHNGNYQRPLHLERLGSILGNTSTLDEQIIVKSKQDKVNNGPRYIHSIKDYTLISQINAMP